MLNVTWEGPIGRPLPGPLVQSRLPPSRAMPWDPVVNANLSPKGL